MIKKKYLKTKPVCKVTFCLPPQAAAEAEGVELVGDFSGWRAAPIPMRRLKSGEFRTTVDLDVGREYHFRYLIDGHRWENDWKADAYVASNVGAEENSVVST